MTATPTSPNLHIERIFGAPRSLVFECFAEAEHVLQWFGPRMFPAVSWKHEFRPGGSFEYEMRGPDGESLPGGGEYLDIVDGERIRFVSRVKNGDRVIYEVLQTVHFADRDQKTALTLDYEVLLNDGFPPEAEAGAEQGWNETFDRLGEHLTRLRVQDAN